MSPAELRTQLEGYLAMRQAVGYASPVERTRLEEFIHFVVSQGNTGPLRAQWAVDWACSSCRPRGAAGRCGKVVRLGQARRFLKYVQASYPATEVPPPGILVSRYRPAPYLFSDQEIEQLLTVARNAPPRNGLRSHTLETLLGLLASTGLRSGEAMRLMASDVQLDSTPPCLLVRQAKFRKSRWVPLHPTTAAKLRDYRDRRSALGFHHPAEPFFVSDRGPHPTARGVRLWFWYVVLRLGMRLERDRRWPCLHSFRHTFAVRRLQAWYEQGADIQRCLNHLSVYLGHVRPQDTYWYLTATPELLLAAAERFHTYARRGGAQ